MNRAASALIAAASLFAFTTIAGTVTAQEEPSPPGSQPPFTSTGIVELELVDQTFDLAPDGDIELTYRLTGDLATVAELAPPTTTTTTTSTTTTSTTTTTTTAPPATDASDTAPPPASPPGPSTSAPISTTSTTTTTTTTVPPPVPLTVRVLNYEPIADPGDLPGLLGPDPRTSRFPAVIDGVDLLDARSMIRVESDGVAVLRISVPTDVEPSVAERLEFDEDGIHPILVQLRVNDQIVARHGTVVERRSSDVTAPPPIDLALIASIDDPGPTADDEAFADAGDELEELIELATVVEAPLTLAIPPSVAAAATNSGDLDDDDAETLRDEEILSAPATPFDVSSAVAVDRVDAFDRQLRAGEDDMRDLLDVVTVRDVWLATAPLSGQGAQALRSLGVRYLAMPADVYAETIGNGSSELPARDRFVELDLPDGSTIPTLLIDDQFGAAFEASRTDEILAEQTPTEWALETIAEWRLAQYGAPQSEQRDRLSRLLAVPGLGTFDPRLIVALENFAADTDAVRFTHASALAGITDTQTAPADAALPETAGPSLAARLERIAMVDADLDDTASMLLDDDPRPAQWSRRLDSVVSTAFTDAEVDTELDELLDEAARIRSGVIAPEPFTFTLTGREEQQIELRIDNILEEELQVLLRLRSPRLSFPEGEMIVTLAADGTTVVDVPVIARSNGTSAVTVEILTPLTQRPLVEPVRLTSRVNSLTGLGRLLTVALVLILATWWISSWRSKRRARDRGAANGAGPATGTDPPLGE